MSATDNRFAIQLVRALSATLMGLVLMGAAEAPAPGVRPTEIDVGSHMDLSGSLSELGVAVRNGISIAFTEVNVTGGVNGRKLKLIAADNAYSTARAVAAVKTLLFRDDVFAILCPVGTPEVAKTMPIVLNAGRLHLFPFASTETFVGQHPLEFAIDLPVAQQIAVGLTAIRAQKGALKVGVLYRDDAMGEAALRGAAGALTRRGERLVAAAVYKPGETNFTAALSDLRQSGAELIVLGSSAQEAITAMQQAQAQDWLPVFLCATACYVPELPTLGGRAVSGLYAVATTPIPYPDDKDAAVRAWVRRYETRFGTVASAEAFRAYLNARMFAEALRRAGPDPTPRRVARALEALSPWKDPVYGGVPVVFSPRDHMGFRTGFLAQIRGGRWTTLVGDRRN